jgi:hypothetical protein
MDKISKLKIRKFYEQEIAKWCEEAITDFKPKSQIGHEFYTPDNTLEEEEEERYQKLSPSSLSSAISKREQVPQNVLNACDRISWYLKHGFGEISVVKVTFQEIITFAICVQGYVDDGWDNGVSLIEVYNFQGELVGSSMIPDIDEANHWRWMNLPIRSYHFNTYVPYWSDEEEEEEIVFKRKMHEYDFRREENRRLKRMMNDY